MIGIACSFVQNSTRAKGNVSPIDTVIRTLCSPVAFISGSIADVIGGFFSGASKGNDLQAENERLKRQIAYLSLYNENVSRLQKEVDSSRSLMNLAESYNREKVFADVIGYFPNEHRITIGAGSKQGLKPGMPVVSAAGLVGRIQTVSGSESQALLLTSAASAVGAVATDHNPPPAGIIRGQNSPTLIINFQTPESPVQSGDLITTPPFSEKIPAGIMIGRVVSVENLPEIGASRALILPSTAVGTLREVVVIK